MRRIKPMIMMPSGKKRKRTIMISTHGTYYSKKTSTHETDDLLFFHILPKLPAKSLLRFTCVSKLWNRSIHHPTFIASHYNHHSKFNPSLVAVISRVYDPKAFLRIMYLNNDQQGDEASSSSSCMVADTYGFYGRILGSCNGLTCIKTEHSIDIFNPCTREILYIPQPKQMEGYYGASSYGFGYDPLANEYKVLVLGIGKCWIRTIGGTTAWKTKSKYSWRDITVTSNLPPSEFLHYSWPYLLNGSGALFWMSNIDKPAQPFDFCYKGTDLKYVSFDMHYEKFQVFPGPKDYIYRLCSAFQLRGCPCLVYSQELNGGLKFVLYSLNQQSSNDYKWVEECVCIPFKPNTTSIRMVEFCGQILLQWVSEDGHFYIYNPKTQSQQKKESSGKLYPQQCRNKALLLVNHIENLYSLKTLVPPSPSPTPTDEAILYVSSRDATMDKCSRYLKLGVRDGEIAVGTTRILKYGSAWRASYSGC